MSMLVSELQKTKLLPIEVTVLGIVTLITFSQLKNALSLIVVIPSAILMAVISSRYCFHG